MVNSLRHADRAMQLALEDGPPRVRSNSRTNGVVLSLAELYELFVVVPFSKINWFFSLFNGSQQMVSSTFSTFFFFFQVCLFLFIKLMYWIYGSCEVLLQVWNMCHVICHPCHMDLLVCSEKTVIRAIEKHLTEKKKNKKLTATLFLVLL